jgi:predicted dehydrogenase
MLRQSKHVTRRGILKYAAAVVASPYVIPSAVLGKDGAVAPSNRLAMGFIGVGAMGQGHLHCFLHYPDAQVVALCDVDRWRREHNKAAADETYAAERARGAYRGCHAYVDLRDLLARDDIDAVVIATGDRWHALATVMAAKAGKDIYCEKPVSLTIAEARTMIDTVRRYGRVFQSGLQQRSDPEFRRACALVQTGAIGKVQIVYTMISGTSDDVDLPADPVPGGLDWDLWLGPAPVRTFNKAFHRYGAPEGVVPWHFCRDFGNGNLGSNTVHAFDTIQWGLGMDHTGPVEVIPPAAGQFPVLTYKYANGVLLQVVDWRLEKHKQFIPKGWDENTPLQNFGAVFVGDRGWIHVGRQGYLHAYPADILKEPSARTDDLRPVNNHHQDWMNCIRSRGRAACDVEVGARSTMVSHLGCIALWTGRPLKWDPAKEVFLGDDDANRWISRPMRSPWTL